MKGYLLMWIIFAKVMVVDATDISGVIASNQTFFKSNSPYIVVGNVLVNSGITLTIEPGVEVKFSGNYGFLINGSLIAAGTIVDSIFFTSNQVVPQPGDWNTIQYGVTSSSALYDGDGNYLSGNILKYCRFSYGGSTNGIVYLNGTAPFISNCKITNSFKTGIFAETTIDGGATISNTTITNCKGLGTGFGSGVHIRFNTSSIKFSNNNVFNNTGGSGIYIDGGGSIINNKIYNNQGASNGGGIFIQLGSILIEENLIYNNSAGAGGGIFTEASSNIVIKCNRIIQNTANEGAAISARADSILNNVIAFNSGVNEIVKLYQGGDDNYNVGNQFYGNTATSVIQIFGGNPVIHKINQNTFSGNAADNTILWTNWSASSSLSLSGNNFLDVDALRFLSIQNNLSSLTIDAKSNFWKLPGNTTIEDKIFHFNDDFNQSIVDYSTQLSSPSILAPISPPETFAKTQNGNNVDLTWTGNTEGDVLGYVVYWGRGYNFNFNNSVDVGNVQSFSINNYSAIDSIGIRAYSSTYLSTAECNNEISWFALANSQSITRPTISTFSPTSGPIGSHVTITGANFSSTPANNIVWFGATQATVTTATSTQLTVTVPAGATYQPITVTINGLTAYSSAPFIVTFQGGGVIDVNSFTAKVDFTIGTTYGVAVGDLDGDGKPDLAVTNHNSNTVSVFRNTSSTGAITASSFAAKVDFTAGTGPFGISIGDLDGDGKPDLAVTHYNSNTVSVFRNTSSTGAINSGSFSAKVDFTTGSYPYIVAIGDLDGDGKPDLAVTNYNSNTVSVFRNTSSIGAINTGSFAVRVDFTTGTDPYSVAIGDLDGDGKPDLAVTNNISNTVSVLKNTTSTGAITASSFAAKVDFATGSSPYSIAIGDLDRDGKPDLAVANYFDHTVSLLKNASAIGAITTGSFAAKVDLITGTGPFGVAIGDLDGDGKPDLAVANGISNTVSVIKNTSSTGAITTGSFTTKVDFTTSTYPYSIAIGDLDGDGKADLVCSHRDGNSVSVFRNTVTSLVPTITSFSPQSGAIGTPVTITGTNFSTTPSNNIVWFGATKATVTNATSTELTVTVPAGATYNPITVTVNGLTAYSPKPFIVSANSNWHVSFSSGLEFSTGSFSPARLQVCDVDGDSKPDAITTNPGNNSVSVLRNIATPGNLASGAFATKVEFTTGSSPSGLALGDLDGDGKPDLVVANGSGLSVSVLKNTSTPGTISFNAKVDFTTGTNPQRVAITDVDGDGKPEILVVNSNNNTVRVFINTGTVGVIDLNTFSTSIDLSTGDNPSGIAIADLDDDGKHDVVVSNYNASTAYVYRNNSSPGVVAFASQFGFATGSNPNEVVTADLDGDGKPEIITADVASFGYTSILRNTSTPGSINSTSFAVRVNYDPPPSFLDGVTIDDVSGDGKPDLGFFSTSSNINVTQNLNVPGTISTLLFQSMASQSIFSMGVDDDANMVICDIDGDNKKELLILKYSGAKLLVFENTSVAEPLSQPTNLSFNNVTASSLSVSFTAATGSPTGYIVLRRQNATPDTDPTDGTSYTVGGGIGSATVAYVGSATSYNETGLGNAATYYYKVYSYNGSSVINYLQTNPLAGNVKTYAIKPSDQATGINFSSITLNTVDVNFTIGNGTSRLVVCKAGAPVDAVPQNGTSYTANNAFGSGSEIGSGNFVVASGSGPFTIMD